MTAPISNGPTTHGYTTMRDATQHGASTGISAKKFARQWASSSISAKNFAQHAIKRPFWAILSTQGELFRAHAHHQAAQGELFRAQGAALGNCETAITTARP